MPATASLDYREDCLEADQGLWLGHSTVFLQRVQDRVLSLASVGLVLEVMLLLPIGKHAISNNTAGTVAYPSTANGAAYIPRSLSTGSALVRYGFCMVKRGLQPARRQLLAHSAGKPKTLHEMRAAAENEQGKSPEYIGELRFASITNPIAHIFMVDRFMMDGEKNFRLAMHRNQRSIARA